MAEMPSPLEDLRLDPGYAFHSCARLSSVEKILVYYDSRLPDERQCCTGLKIIYKNLVSEGVGRACGSRTESYDIRNFGSYHAYIEHSQSGSEVKRIEFRPGSLQDDMNTDCDQVDITGQTVRFPLNLPSMIENTQALLDNFVVVLRESRCRSVLIDGMIGSCLGIIVLVKRDC